MSAQDCLNAIKAVFGDKLSDKQLDDIFTLVDRRMRRMQRDDPLLSADLAARQAAEELASEKKLAALLEKRNHIFAVMRKKSRADFYATAQAQGISKAEAIRALNVGREGPWERAGFSVDAQMHGLEQGLTGPLVGELRQAGLLEVARMKNPDFEMKVAQEMSRLNGGDAKATGDAHARQMAEIFNRYVEASRVMQNEAGGYIRKLPGYIVRQSHDQLKIAKAGYETWRAKVIDLLDERTFDNADGDIDHFLRNVYANLASGNHLKAGGMSDWLGGFKGPGNLAKKVSQERSLHFKDAESWMAYNREFGRESLWEAVLDNMHYSARNTALMRAWGPNPEAAFTRDMDEAILEAKDRGDIEEVNRLQNWRTKAEFQEISGGITMRGNPTVASYAAGARAWINMTKLGGVVLSSLPDIAVRAAVLRHNGVPLVESYRRSMNTFFEGRSGTEKRQIADYLNVGVQGILGETFQRFHAIDSAPGTLTKLSHTFFRATGLTWWTDSLSRGVGLILSRHMAGELKGGAAFANLDGRHRTTLNRYGIGEKEWGVLSKADLKMADGEDFLMPDAIRGLDDTMIRDYLDKSDASERLVKDTREELATKLATYYADQVREAMTFGGARERVWMTGGLSAGTPWGEAIRFIMQFKQFPITFWGRHVGRELRRGGGVDKGGLAHLIVATTALGYVAMNAKDMAKGREPREVTAENALQVIMASMQQGGGLGIYGDFLFSNSNRFGGGIVGTMAGPGAGMLEQYVSVLQAARDGQDPRAKAFKAAVDSTPFLNIFYARLALDHLVLHGLQESLNPGYLRRYEKFIERENDQEFWLAPTDAVRY